MRQLLQDIQHNKLLWLLAFVPVVFAAEQLQHDAHTLLFVLSVLAIVPLTVLLSLATVSVAAKTGDAVGGLLNATLGNLAELVIALAALRAGQYMLVKASIAGTIVTNTLFILGASFLLGGLKHHEQEYNRVSARMQAGLLFLATVALLIPSAISHADSAAVAFSHKLSVGLAVLLIVSYGLSTLFSLVTHRESFGSVQHAEVGEAPWPIGVALATLGGVTVLVALVSEIFVESVQQAAEAFGMTPAFVGFIILALVGGASAMPTAFSGARNEPAGLERGHRTWQRVPNRALRCAGACARELCHRADADGPSVLAGRRGDDAHRRTDRLDGHQQRALGVVRGCPAADGLCDLRDDALPAAAPSAHDHGPSKRVLDPIDRVSEVLFGLIMVLTFTGSLSVAEAGRDDVRTMLIGALGCNVAWGIIDAMLYLMGCLAEKGQSLKTYLAVRKATDLRKAQRLIADALPPVVASILEPEELETMRRRLMQLPEPPERARLSKDDWQGSIGVFLIVFVSTFPVVIPFMFMQNVGPALRVSNAIAIVMLFLTGYAFGSMTGRHPGLVGIAMVALGSILVGMTMALGG